MLELGAGAISTYSRLVLSARLSSYSKSIQRLLEQGSDRRDQLDSLEHKYCDSVEKRHKKEWRLRSKEAIFERR